MMRRLLSLMLFLAVVGMVSAQVPMRRDLKKPQHLKVMKSGLKNQKTTKFLKAPKKAIELNSDQMWFGYGNDAVGENMGIALNADYNLAIFIPCEKIAGKGSTIDGVRFMLQSAKAKNIKAWVGTELPAIGNYSEGANLEVKDVDPKDVVLDGYTEVAFSKSYEIPEGGLWIGYSFDIEGMEDAPDDSEVSDEDYMDWYYDVYMPWLENNLGDAYPFIASYIDEPLEGTMVFASNYYDELYKMYAEIDPENAEDYLSMLGWDDYSPYGYCVAINALFGGGKFMNNAASVTDFGQKYALINSTVTFPVTLTNNGKNGITDFTYEVSINGKKVDEQTVTLETPIENLLKKTTIELSFPTGDQSGSQNIVVTITKVNGQPNELTATAYGAIFVVAESAKMKPLIEEYTGTWCGWCTRGWVALEMLSEDFKDDAVIYAVHNGDPMEIDAFMNVVYAHANGFPSMSINRTKHVDPYYGSTGEAMGIIDDLNLRAREFWKSFLENNRAEIAKILYDGSMKGYRFGDTQMTRPYMDYSKSADPAKVYSELKKIWDNRSVLIVEGYATRMGVGNDLFDNARSINRIICPAENAYGSYDRIKAAVTAHCSEELVLLALGPTATVLAADLSDEGLWAIDVGHLDVEYEWYKNGVKEKTAIKGKYVNEVSDGRAIEDCSDETYLGQIIARV